MRIGGSNDLTSLVHRLPTRGRRAGLAVEDSQPGPSCATGV